MYAKAIAALITPIVVGFLMPFGIDESTNVSQAIEIIVVAISTALTVYLVPNKVK